jgi:hypothetical protein
LAPQSFQAAGFSCHLTAACRLTAEIVVENQYASHADIRGLVRAWEGKIALATGVKVQWAPRGRYVCSAPPESRLVRRESPLAETVTEAASPEREGQRLDSLPSPPTDYAETRDLWALQWRIKEYREGRDRLLALGYYALTVCCARFGGVDGMRKETARQMAVSQAVLRKLGELQRPHALHGRAQSVCSTETLDE